MSTAGMPFYESAPADTNAPVDHAEDANASSRWSALLLGLMMILVPAIGVPSDEMLQDTLKSAIVSLMAIGTTLVFLWLLRHERKALTWHGLMWLPLALATYAIGSMIWSHTYLGGVEAVRWLVFSLILWLGTNIQLEHFEDRVLWGIQCGITLASVWAALQFWTDFSLFPQAYLPASTFVNCNFFAEFAICCLPYSAFLLVRSRDYRQALGLSIIIGFNVVALLMTGTRSALVGLLIFFLLAPAIYLRCRQQLEAFTWSRPKKLALIVIFLGTVLTMGLIPTKNTKVLAGNSSVTAISRSIGRTASIAESKEYTSGTFSIRATMWAATWRMIKGNPIAGVGAGAWEVAIPLYQMDGSQLETDFYAHNELLQLVAEYGLLGLLFLGLLFAYLVYSARQGWTDRSEVGRQLTPLRATALASVLMLLIVSNAGFPWRLASSGALFALSLSLLAACDARAGKHRQWLATYHQCEGVCNRIVLLFSMIAMALALYITQRAAECEKAIVQGIKLAITISRAGNATHPYWDKEKTEMLNLMRRGIALNGHYRKLTPVAADALAGMGDWKNALWIWESLYRSRPNVVAIIINIARAQMELENFTEAQVFMDKANRLQPNAAAVRSLNAILLFRRGKESIAGEQIKALFKENIVDYDLVHAAYHIGQDTKDFPLMIQALELRMRYWPQETVDSWIKIGLVYTENAPIRDDAKALSAFRAAVAATPGPQREVTLNRIPANYRSRL